MAGLLSFLSDITIKPPEIRGPLEGLLGTSDYGVSTFRYPSDLASADKGHYMLININEQRLTSYLGTGALNELGLPASPTAIGNNQGLGSFAAGATNTLQTIGSGVREAGSIGGYIANQILGTSAGSSLSNILNKSSGGQAVVGATSESLNIIGDIGARLESGSVRAEKRITDVIALYMPDTLVFDQHQSYGEVGAGGQLFTAGVALAGSTVDLYKNNSMTPQQKGAQFARNVSPFIASMLAKDSGGLAQIAFSQAFGVVQNPMLEVLYSSPKFREFRFDFMFYPRSEKESKEVQNIISKLRFHQAPEVAQGGTGGFFMVPPSEFDITFYYSGQENLNIPKISTCVLDSLTVDYAPNGFSAYEVPGQGATVGGTGMPVAIRLSLGFKETEMVTKSSIVQTRQVASGQEMRTTEEINYSKSLGDFPG
jgi:hypothetical protein